MKKAKKLTALALSAAMLLSLAGCGANGGNNSKNANTDSNGAANTAEENKEDGNTSSDGAVTLTFWSWLPTTEPMVWALTEI